MSALGARSNNSERTPSYKRYLTLREPMALNRFRKNRWIYGNRVRWRRIQNIQDLLRWRLIGQLTRKGRKDQIPILTILLIKGEAGDAAARVVWLRWTRIDRQRI